MKFTIVISRKGEEINDDKNNEIQGTQSSPGSPELSDQEGFKQHGLLYKEESIIYIKYGMYRQEG